jgi:glyoxylase-like metal-dependent hydrolase (beta-lactamase superfamily II)
VALNCYYDHAGGWHSFADRACHPLDAGELRNPDRENASYSVYLNDDSLSALPRMNYSTSDYRMIGAEPTRLLNDCDVIYLGNRSLEVLHVPGRSPGGIALWEAETGSLFSSDMLYDGNHGPAWPPDNPELFMTSLLRFRNLPVINVYPGHYGPFDAERMKVIIDEQTSKLEGEL